MCRFFVIILFLTFNSIVFSQYEIGGKVFDNRKKTSLSGIQVHLLNLNKTEITNNNGEFLFQNVPSGQHIVKVENEGYSTRLFTIDLSKKSQRNLQFKLNEFLSTLPEIVLTQKSLTGGDSGVDKLPGSAFYISPKELQKFNYSDINRVLKKIPGVSIQEEEGFGLRPNIGMRGTGLERSSKITLMEDGILIAPAPYSASAAYYFPNTMRMQAIEVLKGSSQIKYGPFTTGGAINLISTQIPDSFKAKVNVSGGSFTFKNIYAFIGDQKGRIGYSFEALHFGSNGFKQLDNSQNTGFNKSDYQFKFQINPKKDSKYKQSLFFKFGYNNELSHETYLGLSREDFESNPYMRYDASQWDNMKNHQTQFNLSYSIHPTENLSIVSTIYRNDFHRNWYKLSSVIDTNGVKKSISEILYNPYGYNNHYNIIRGLESSLDNSLIVKGNNRTYFSQGIQTNAVFNLNKAPFNQKIEISTRLHMDGMDRFQNEDRYRMQNGEMYRTFQGALGLESNKMVHAAAWSSFLQYELEWNKLFVIAGLRKEFIRLSETDYGKNDPLRNGTAAQYKNNDVLALLPGFSLNYSVTKKLKFFSGIHKGFAPPSSDSLSNPESSTNMESGFKFLTSNIQFQLVGFYNAYDNLLGSDMAFIGGDGSTDQYNGGRSQIHGVEFFGSYIFKSKRFKKFRFPVTLSYTYTNGTFLSSFESEFDGWGTVEVGDEMPYISKNLMSLSFSLEYEKFNLNYNVRYVSDMRAVAGQGFINENDLIPSNVVMDLNLNFLVSDKISLFGNVLNLTNKTYIAAMRPAGLRPGMPRLFQFGIKGSF